MDSKTMMELRAAAAEEIRKREPALTKEQAITRVYSERPELVEGYCRETM